MCLCRKVIELLTDAEGLLCGNSGTFNLIHSLIIVFMKSVERKSVTRGTETEDNCTKVVHNAGSVRMPERRKALRRHVKVFYFCFFGDFRLL